MENNVSVQTPLFGPPFQTSGADVVDRVFTSRKLSKLGIVNIKSRVTCGCSPLWENFMYSIQVGRKKKKVEIKLEVLLLLQ